MNEFVCELNFKFMNKKLFNKKIKYNCHLTQHET